MGSESRRRLAALARLIHAAEERYRAHGVRGSLRLPGLTESERVALAGLLRTHVRTRPGETLTLSLSALDQALREGSIAAGLPEAIAAFSDKPVETKAERQAAVEHRWQAFTGHLSALAAAGGGRAAVWLEALTRRESSAFSVLQREFNQEERAGECQHHRLRRAVESVAAALDRLPTDASATARLPVFAQEITGDPHGFDEGALAGRLLIRALTDLAGPSCGVHDPPQGALERGILLSAAGLLTDGVSSTIACFGLQGAGRNDGSRDRQAEGAAADRAVLVAPLRQVSQWAALDLCGSILYAVENPPVFEDLVDHLTAAGGAHPTLLCTSGFLSVAAVKVLDLAVGQGARLAYGGDFDLKGLTIAAGLLRRYGDQVTLWGMSPEDYLLAAQHPLAEELPAADLARLGGLGAPALAPLVSAMQRTGKRAYQEALLPLLKDSLQP